MTILFEIFVRKAFKTNTNIPGIDVILREIIVRFEEINRDFCFVCTLKNNDCLNMNTMKFLNVAMSKNCHNYLKTMVHLAHG